MKLIYFDGMFYQLSGIPTDFVHLLSNEQIVIENEFEQILVDKKDILIVEVENVARNDRKKNEGQVAECYLGYQELRARQGSIIAGITAPFENLFIPKG